MADGQRTPDELKQARDRRVFAQTLQEVKQHHPYEHRRERNVRIILEAGSFSEDDLLRMLRGQLLCWDGDACQQTVRLPADEPEDIDPGEEYDTGDELLRRIGQSGLGGPLGPVPHPRNHLMCPLQERALSGDKSVPCHEALRQAIAPGDRFVDVEPEIGDSYAMMYIKMGGLQPCQEFFCLALDSLGSLVKQSARGDAD